MKKLIQTILILLLFAACGNNSYVAEKWDNGKDKIVLRIDKGSKDKPEVYYMKVFYPNGNLCKEGLVKDSVEDGEWISYYATGEIKSKGSYSMGNKVGEYNIYYRDGKTEQTGKYEGDSIIEASIYDSYGKLITIDSTELWLDTSKTKPKWDDVNYATMHMECNMLFFDNYDRGTQVCSCFLDIVQHQLTIEKYQSMTERQITFLMKYLMPEYAECIGK